MILKCFNCKEKVYEEEVDRGILGLLLEFGHLLIASVARFGVRRFFAALLFHETSISVTEALEKLLDVKLA